MVRRESDGQTLYFPGPDGTIVRVSMMDSDYNKVAETQDLQISARNQNNHKKDVYTQAVKNAQVSVDASRDPGPLPNKPLQIVVTDPTIDEYGDIVAGVQSEIPWVGLPEVKPKK